MTWRRDALTALEQGTLAWSSSAAVSGATGLPSPDEADRLLSALGGADRVIWATALCAGLRRGELIALDWTSIDLAGGLIQVERSWDEVAGFIGLKPRWGSAEFRSRRCSGLRGVGASASSDRIGA